MATLEDLERRINELEERLDRERRTTLQALGETQSDHGRALRRIENAVSGLTTEMGNFRLEVRAGFAAIGDQLDRLIANDQGGE
jgi:hypothetical protein